MALSVSHTGSNTGGPASSLSLSVSASAGDDIIIGIETVDSSNINLGVLSISGGSLTWTQRTSTGAQFNGVNLWWQSETWSAKNSGSLSSATITITANGSVTAIDGVYISVSGANTTAPFDVNAALPVKVNNSSADPPSSTVSTTATNTILFSLLSTLGTLTSADWPTGWSGVVGGFSSMTYLIVSSAQSSAAVTWQTGSTGGNTWSMINDAFQQAGASTPLTASRIAFI